MAATRFSHILKTIKTFQKYGVGTEAVIQLTAATLSRAILNERFVYIGNSYVNGIGSLTKYICGVADKAEMLDRFMDFADSILKQPYAHNSESAERMDTELQVYLSSLKH